MTARSQTLLSIMKTNLVTAEEFWSEKAGTEPLIRVMLEGKDFKQINEYAIAISEKIKERAGSDNEIKMKIVVINGQNHKGSTYHLGRILAEKISDDITEFFLPRDFGEFCCGCTNCFAKSETLCPLTKNLSLLRKLWTVQTF